MHNGEAINMLERAASEIEMLQKQVARLEPKAQAYDALVKVLDITGNRAGYAATENWPRLFRERAKELKAELEQLAKDRTGAVQKPAEKYPYLDTPEPSDAQIQAAIDAKRAHDAKQQEAQKLSDYQRVNDASLYPGYVREEADEEGATRLIKDTDFRK